MQLIISKR